MKSFVYSMHHSSGADNVLQRIDCGTYKMEDAVGNADVFMHSFRYRAPVSSLYKVCIDEAVF